jgi:adenylate kinase family enzyme
MLIAFTGRAGSGKDTAADFLTREYGFHKTAFAAALKASARSKFGLSEWHTDTEEGKRTFIPAWGMTVRRLLQVEGTEATRNFYGTDFWVKRWEMTYRVLQDSGIENIVVVDCRFEEEAQAILELGGYVIEITRPDPTQTGLVGAEAAHSSEAGVSKDLLDFSISNDGSQEDLFRKVRNIMGTLSEGEATCD